MQIIGIHESVSIKKISFKDFQAAENGDPEQVKQVIDMFQSQRMVIVTDVPYTSEILDKTHHGFKEAARNPEAHYFEGTFAVTTNMRKPVMMFDQMNNVFPYGEETALKNAEALNIKRDDCYDLLGRQEPLNIPGVDSKKLERDFTSHGREISLKFLSIIDKHRGKNKTSIRGLAEMAESQKYRHIFLMPIECLPEDPQRNIE